MYYGINDATSGVSGSSNTINNNTITGFTTSAVKKDVATTQALNTIGFLSYTPVVTAETGTITSYTSTGNYYEIGKMVFFTIGIVITNAGTGSNAVLATLPFTNTSINCTAIGKENSISGNTLEGLIASNATTIKIVNYNSSSTLSTGATITVTGFYQRV